MLFKEFGNKGNPKILLIHGFGVSWELFIPLVDKLSRDFHIIVPLLDGHIVAEGQPIRTRFSTIDDAALRISEYLLENNIHHLHRLYGISLGGCIATRMTELNRISVERLIIDAGPILPYGWFVTQFCGYYQAVNCWCTYHFAGLYKILFRSHYFHFSIDQVRKTFPAGVVQSAVPVYRSMFAYKVQSLPEETEVHYWHGSKESWVFDRCVKHILTIRPDTQVCIFPKMQHAELVIEHPESIIASLL